MWTSEGEKIGNPQYRVMFSHQVLAGYEVNGIFRFAHFGYERQRILFEFNLN